MIVEDWGLINYQEAQKKQHQYVEEVLQGKRDETLVICSHYPVVTLGKKALQKGILDWSGDIVETKRGGQATYHGPGQIISYPILNLNMRNKDIYHYLRQLEKAMSLSLEECGLKSFGNPENTGLWVGEQKIASIGVAIKRWVTYHGLAINIEKDPLAFKGINPCGMSQNTMTCLEDFPEAFLDRPSFQRSLTANLLDCLHPKAFPICQEVQSISQ
ncbi:MAG: lipoyl(octanoyl) transferase LipB [Bacteriovoracaceae bacterium]|nr:lipoyl(octanoyl) transferase LipB [Bacteriovoracaceae bacterium]